MDINSLMPLMNMLSSGMKTNESQPTAVAPVESLSQDDHDYIRQNTSIYPESFKTQDSFKAAQPTNAAPVPETPKPTNSPMNLNSLMPLLGSMSGGGANTDMISKLMQNMGGVGGGGGMGDMGGLLSLFSGMGAGKAKTTTPKKTLFKNNVNPDKFIRT